MRAQELALQEITSTFTFEGRKAEESAKDCLVACVMAIDADDDGGAKLVMRKKSAQSVVIRAMERLEKDKEAATACCMLLRNCLRSGAKERLKQVAHYIESGLGGGVTGLMELHSEDTGVFNTECAALVEELGTQFERVLNPL